MNKCCGQNYDLYQSTAVIFRTSDNSMVNNYRVSFFLVQLLESNNNFIKKYNLPYVGIFSLFKNTSETLCLSCEQLFKYLVNLQKFVLSSVTKPFHAYFEKQNRNERKQKIELVTEAITKNYWCDHSQHRRKEMNFEKLVRSLEHVQITDDKALVSKSISKNCRILYREGKDITIYSVSQARFLLFSSS